MRKTKKQILAGVNLENVKSSKFIANNTLQLHYRNDVTVYRLHNTDIVTVDIGNGKVFLNSGGYRTATTKDRINRYTPQGFNVYQKNHVWYVKTLKGVYTYYDSIAFDLSGNIITEVKADKTKEVNKIKKDIKKYVNLLDKLENLPIPENGNCWHCLFKDKATGQTLGDISKSDHLQQHIKEGYIFGALLVNAMKNYGYRDEQIAFHYQIKAKDTFKRALKKYLYKNIIK